MIDRGRLIRRWLGPDVTDSRFSGLVVGSADRPQLGQVKDPRISSLTKSQWRNGAISRSLPRPQAS